MKATQAARKEAAREAANAMHAARLAQLKQSARETLRSTKAAPTAVLRSLARVLPKTERREFIAVFTAKPFNLTPGTVSTQLQRGRHERRR